MKERQKDSTNYPISFMLVLKSDHITGAAGKTNSIVLTIAKSGDLAFSAPAVPIGITDIGNGWYTWAPKAADRNTAGELKIHVAEATCDPYDEKYDIVLYDPFAAVSLSTAERNALADAILTRDWFATAAAITTIPARCLLQAMRLLRNKWAVSATSGVLSVYAENGSDIAWQMTTQSHAGADPIVGQVPTP